MSMSLLCRTRRVAIACAGLLGIAACGDSNGPSDDVDLVGRWSWQATAAASGVSCNITKVEITITRTGNALAARVVSAGGNNIACVAGNGPTTANFTFDSSVPLTQTGENIGFELATSAGAWTMSGRIVGRNQLEGDATIRLGSSGGVVTFNGTWASYRIFD